MVTAIMAALLGFGSFCASAAEYAPVSFLHASEAQLEQFPIEGKRLSAARQAELGLRPYSLQSDALFFNHQREGKFALKLMKTGTVVLVDKDGTPRYEEKCGNRLVDPQKLQAPEPKSEIGEPYFPQPPIVVQAPEPKVSALDSVRAWVNKLPEPAKLATHALGWLGALALLAAALVLAFWGLSALVGSARHSVNARNWHRPTRIG